MKTILSNKGRLLLFLPVFLLFSSLCFSQQTLTTINGWNAYVHLPDDYNLTGSKTYPTIIFFPGTGEVGTDPSKLLIYGPSAFIASGWNGYVTVNGATVKPIIISLQPPALYPQPALVDVRVETIKSLYRVDPTRLSMTGLSMGGWTSEMYVENSLAFAQKVASIVAVQAVKPDDNPAYPAPFTTYAQNCGHWLGYEQIYDNRDMPTIANTMNAAVPGSAIYFQTNVGGGGHCCWNTWYDPNHTDNYSLNGVSGNWNIYQYMLTWNGCGGPVPPTANPGSNQTITLPASTVTLNGSASTGNGGATITGYSWAKTSGGAASITSPTAATTTVTGLAAGTYVFTLTVTDNNGLTSSSTVTITVNAAAVAPTANAGTNQTITLPASTVTLNGSASTGNGGATITGYSWAKTSGGAASITSPTAATTTVTGLAAGTYVFTLTVTDNNGLTSSSTVTITVNAAAVAPTANAGTNQTITLPASTVTLNGSASTGNGGATITGYSWAKTSGGAASITSPTAATTTVTGLAAGTYVFTLTVTDNNGLTSSSTVTITVNAAAVAPTANAGTNQTITLPTSTVTLNGSASTGNGGATITGYSWAKTSGGAASITSPTAATTTVTGLAAGTYVFTLTVTDNNGLTSSSTVTITVNAAAVAPTANAGTNQTITLPASTVTLNGSASTGNGGATITGYSWAKTSGGAASITSPTAATTTVTGLAAGTYVFTLTVTDNNGLTSSSTVTITVNAAAVAPTANAGTNQTITLPASTVTLNGSASTGNGGATITGYSWAKTSGGAASITSPTAATTTVTGLAAGTYVFTLTVTDNNGLTSSSTVNITVNAAVSGGACGCDLTIVPSPVDGTAIIDGNVLGAKPGNKVCLKAGHYISISLSNFTGAPGQPITIINCGGQVNVSGYPAYGFTLHGSRYVHISGAGDPGFKYGIYVDGSVANTSYGFGEDDHVSDIEVDHVEVYKTGGVGMGAAPTPTCDPNTWATSWKMYNMSFHDNYVHETTGEGFYIGNTQQYYTYNCSGSTVTVQPQQIDSIQFYNNIIDKSGWTSAQISQVVGYADIHDNVVTNFGAANKPQHQAGIILGGISHGRVYNNRIISGTGNAFELFGAGITTVYNNVFANAGYDGSVQGQGAVFIDDRPKPPGFPPLRVYLLNNTIVNPKRNGVSFYNDYGTVDTGNILANNIITAPGLYASFPTYSFYDLQNNPHATLYNNLNSQYSKPVKFVDTTNNDYHLILSSPAIDSGMNVSSFGVIRDLEGTGRPYGTGYDIGAYEYNGGAPPPLVANAGGNKTIAIPTTSLTLDGSKSYDPAGTITSYSWTQLSGPNTGSIATPASVSTLVSGLMAGTYSFKLTITDNLGRTAADSMVLQVNPAPPLVANAGGNQTITLPTSSITLDGSKSSDPAGTINSNRWVQLSGPNTATIGNSSVAITTASGLTSGTYKFKLTITDNLGRTAVDSMVLQVNPAPPPVANAGGTLTIVLPTSSANLDGSKSTDPGGNITVYAWVQVSGPNTASIANPNSATPSVSGLIQGTYTFKLTVTDNRGLSSSDVMTLIVNPALPPVANAGGNQSITLPVNTINLDGSKSTDPGGNITSYSWTQLSGPNTASIQSPAAVSTQVTGLIQGTYTFKLVVVDNRGATAFDTMVLLVNPAPVPKSPPVAIAGLDTTIYFPVSQYNLDGSASYANSGSLVTYGWRQISGPVAASFSQAAAARTTVSQLVPGQFAFELTVVDNNGLSARDTVVVLVSNYLRYLGSLKVYPNPVVGTSLTIEGLNEYLGKARVVMYDISGRLVQDQTYDKQTSQFRQTLDMTRLAAGSYILNIIFNGQDKPLVFKLIKQ